VLIFRKKTIFKERKMMIAIPGFEAVFAITCILAVVWYLRRNKDDDKEEKNDDDKRGHG
jgi:hypothetical protein